jgi:hypothetical protein
MGNLDPPGRRRILAPQRHRCHAAGEITDIPSGELTMFFPVKSLTAVPMRVTSEDEALFPDLAALHAERLGIRPDPMAGQLTDVFVVARDGKHRTAFGFPAFSG